MLGDDGPASFVVSHRVTPVCVTTPLHCTQVDRNITKTIQFGHVQLVLEAFRSDIAVRGRCPLGLVASQRSMACPVSRSSGRIIRAVVF
jgi:hypothetical protein